MTRAQSETIGFILVFALIVTSTGVVYVAGFSTLDDARTAEELQNMERAFDVLDDSIEDVARRGAPSRSTEMRLGNGNLGFGDEVRINITADGASFNITTQPIVYRLDDTEIAYTSGAVIRSDRGNPVMRSEPAWVSDDGRVILPLVDVDRGGDSAGIGGSSTALIQTERKSSPSVLSVPADGTPVKVTVKITSPRAEAWQRLLQQHGFESCPLSGEQVVSCSTEADDVHVVVTTVSVDFRQ